jgi:hypothetical protein
MASFAKELLVSSEQRDQLASESEELDGFDEEEYSDYSDAKTDSATIRQKIGLLESIARQTLEVTGWYPCSSGRDPIIHA